MADPELNAYNRALYAKSPAWRLKVINYQRRYRGSPPIASLDEVGAPIARRGPDGRFQKVLG
jgi:hypothetical protein